MQNPMTVKRKVTGDSLNIRAQPTISAPLVGQYQKGEVVVVAGVPPVQADNHSWQPTVDGRGWVAVDLTAPVEESVPPAAGSGPAAPGVTVLSTSQSTGPAPSSVPPPAGSGSAAPGVTVLSTSQTTGPALGPASPTAESVPAAPGVTVLSTSQNAAPAPSPAPTASGWAPPFHAQMRGVGASAGGWAPEGRHVDLVKKNNIEVLFIVAYESGQAAKTIQPMRDAGVKHFILRAAIHEAITTPQRFVEITTPTLKEYANALGGSNELMIAVHNEVNLVQEGWTKAWADGAAFAEWWHAVAASYRQSFPGAMIGFPAMSPGGSVPGVRLDEGTFLAQARSAIDAADWVGVHFYWVQHDGSDINPPIAQWRQWYGNKPLIGTEVGPADATTVNPNAVRIAYQKFGAIGVPAMAWLLTGAGAWHNAAWDEHGIFL